MQLVDLLVLHKIAKKHHAKKLIKEGHMTINGHVITENIEIHNEDVFYDNQRLDSHPLKYYMLNKPSHYLCANKDEHEPCVIDLMPRTDLHMVGRLDRDTTGLLLLTNDLKLRKRLTLPLYQIEKTYYFTCQSPLTKEVIEKTKEGVIIDHDHVCQCHFQMINDYEGYITIYEGRYHEVKKILRSLNNRILSLKRVSFCHLPLGDLQEGEYRLLTNEEITILRESVHLD